MSYSLSVWLDDEAEKILKWLCKDEKRTRSGMVKALIKREQDRKREKEIAEK